MVLLVCVALFVGCAPGDPKSVEALENIQHPDEAFRLNGLSTLSKMGDKAKPHADKVAALLKDTSPEVREMAVSLLIDWGHSSPEVVQELSAMAAGDENAFPSKISRSEAPQDPGRDLLGSHHLLFTLGKNRL